MIDTKPYPNGYDCSDCPHWDDINGCWANETNCLACDYRLSEEEEEDYNDEDYYEAAGYFDLVGK